MSAFKPVDELPSSIKLRKAHKKSKRDSLSSLAKSFTSEKSGSNFYNNYSYLEIL
jgi:hypothetical protein